MVNVTPRVPKRAARQRTLQENRSPKVQKTENAQFADIRRYSFFTKNTANDCRKKQAIDYLPLPAVSDTLSQLELELQKLQTLFATMDKTVWVFYDGDASLAVSFSEIKHQVESVSRRYLMQFGSCSDASRQFNLQDLQKILHLYPESFRLTCKSSTDFLVEYHSNQSYKDPDFLASRQRNFETRCVQFKGNTVPPAELPVLDRSRQTSATQRVHELKKSAADVHILLRSESKLKPAKPEPVSIEERRHQLRDRIRAKQTEKENAARNALPPDITKKLALLGRLPLMVDVLLQIQATRGTEGTVHMILRKMVEIVRDSARVAGVPPTPDEAADAIRLLFQIVPKWCCIVKVGIVESVKLSRSSLSRDDILEKIKKERERLSTVL